MVGLYEAGWTVTRPSACEYSPFQPCVICCPAVNFHVNVQGESVELPVFVMTVEAVKPPGHESVIVYRTVQETAGRGAGTAEVEGGETGRWSFGVAPGDARAEGIPELGTGVGVAGTGETGTGAGTLAAVVVGGAGIAGCWESGGGEACSDVGDFEVTANAVRHPTTTTAATPPLNRSMFTPARSGRSRWLMALNDIVSSPVARSNNSSTDTCRGKGATRLPPRFPMGPAAGNRSCAPWSPTLPKRVDRICFETASVPRPVDYGHLFGRPRQSSREVKCRKDTHGDRGGDHSVAHRPASGLLESVSVNRSYPIHATSAAGSGAIDTSKSPCVQGKSPLMGKQPAVRTAHIRLYSGVSLWFSSVWKRSQIAGP